ncbi:type II toxin-antitoxin system death-on-curing family toxin [Corynebacterium sp. NML98-0116]|uniref:type II toxin-antitoxin system death-on-curing family toxin n=1 Tax=Corynebacterium sp. NML98-0116 TaxID=702967 RepID=UPI00143BAE3E|nr:type II toxin-antitoxin system death-on-curing family toxin [Corynebacterium sp. NML98-0116]
MDVAAVIDLNRSLIRQHFNVIDQSKLEGALAAPLRTWAGQYLYQSPVERAAILLEQLTNAHAFLDGNKRTAWICGAVYLEQCGFVLEDVADEEIVEFMIEVAENTLGTEAIADWLIDHLA